jgi:hypothetical protein
VQAVRVACREPHADVATHREADVVDGVEPELVEESDEVEREGVHVVAVARGRRPALAPPVDRDAAVVILQGLDLVGEHPPAEQQPVAEHDGLGVRLAGRRSGVGVVNVGIVDVDDRHDYSCPSL